LGAVPMLPAELATFMGQGTEKWARVIRTAKIKVE
jgi:hypothetical protein